MSVVHLAKLNRGDLGEGKETLGDRDDILHLPHRVDSVFDGLSVFCTSTIEDTPDFGNLGLSPITVGFTDGLEYNSRVKTAVTLSVARQYYTYLCDESEEQEETGGDHSFLVHHIEFLRDCGGDQTRTEDDGTGLREQVGGRGKLVDDLGGPLCWWLGRHSPPTRHER